MVEFCSRFEFLLFRTNFRLKMVKKKRSKEDRGDLYLVIGTFSRRVISRETKASRLSPFGTRLPFFLLLLLL